MEKTIQEPINLAHVYSQKTLNEAKGIICNSLNNLFGKNVLELKSSIAEVSNANMGGVNNQVINYDLLTGKPYYPNQQVAPQNLTGANNEMPTTLITNQTDDVNSDLYLSIDRLNKLAPITIDEDLK